MGRACHNTENRIFNKKYFAILIILFLLYIRHIGANGLFTILDDEFGYWGNAAYFSGLDWSDTISIIPYYSYGYSILLVPFLLFIDNPIIIYKAAIILNGILLIASYTLCYDISRKLTSNINDTVLLGISFLISIYPAYILYSNIAWSECLLIFVFWLLTWCFVNLDIDSSNLRFVMIGLLSTYIYTIHQRTIGILIASMLTILLMKILKKINMKQFLSVVISVAIILVIHNFIKADIQENLWSNGLGSLINDYSRQVGKVKSLLTLDGQIDFLKVFMGQFYTLGVSSFLVFYVGFFEIISKIRKLLFASLRNKDNSMLNCDRKCYLYSFLFLSVVLSLAVSVIFFINPTRIDQIVYGRYMDIIVGPIILLGLIKLIRIKSISTKHILAITMTFGIYSFIMYSVINFYNLSRFCPQHSVGLVFMATQYKTLIPYLLCILGFLLIVKSLNNQKLLIVSFVVAGLIFFITGETAWNLVSSSGQVENEIVSTANMIKKYDSEIPVYFLWDKQISNVDEEWTKLEDRGRYYPEYYQFLLKERKVNFANKEELDSLDGERLVIIVGTADQIGLSGGYIYCMNAVESNLYYYSE